MFLIFGLIVLMVDIQYIYLEITTSNSYILRIIVYAIMAFALIVEGILPLIGNK